MLKISVVIICLLCLYFVDASSFCYQIELPEGLIKNNMINVVYTMKSSCKSCTQTVNMFPSLKALLERKGIKVQFIVAVSHKSDRLSGLVPHITLNRRQVWKELGKQNDHFYIIDRCGRMAYEIIYPWSSLRMPFLQAAILATHGSHPCGLCPQDYKVEEEKLKIYPPMIEENHTREKVPLDIVMKSRHMHEGDPNVYNYIILTSHGRPGYHRHLPDENRIKTKLTTSEPSAYSSDIINDKNEKLSAEQTIITSHSINNVDDISLRMANKTQLVLSSSEVIDSLVNNTASSESNTESELNTSIETSTELNSQSETESSSEDYQETSEDLESVKEHTQLGSDETLNRESVKEHYKKILNWVDKVVFY